MPKLSEAITPNPKYLKFDMSVLPMVGMRTAALLAILISLCVLSGWLLGIPWLKSVGLPLGSMEAPTAAAVAALGSSLLLVSIRKTPSVWILGLCLGLATVLFTLWILIETALGRDDFGVILRWGMIPQFTAAGLLLSAVAASLNYADKPILTGLGAWLGSVVGMIGAFMGLSGIVPSPALARIAHLAGVKSEVALVFLLFATAILSWATQRITEYPLMRHFLWRRIFLLATMTGVTALGFFVWAFAATNDYEAISASLKSITRETAILAEEHAARSLDPAYLVINLLREQLRTFGPEHMMASSEEWERTHNLVSITPQIASILVSDANGRLLLESDRFPARTDINYADSEFMSHARQYGSLPYFGMPFRGRLTHKEVFILTEGVTSPDGKFLGFINAALDIGYFRTLYGNLRSDRNFAFAIARTSGGYLVREPESVDPMNDSFPDSDQERVAVANSSVGMIDYKSPLNGAPRWIAYRRVGPLPLVVMVSLNSDDFLPAWAAAEGRNAPFLALFILLQGLLTWRSISSLHQEEEDYWKLMDLATHDPLTGAQNRRAFREIADRYLAGSRRHGTGLCALIIDADRFKNINDRYGHQVGDQVLKEISKACLGQLRDVDVFARLGGEEFAVALPGSNMEGALLVAERIREACAKSSISFENGKVQCTVSIGVAVAGGKKETLDELLSRADAALYRAKAAGRDRVMA